MVDGNSDGEGWFFGNYQRWPAYANELHSIWNQPVDDRLNNDRYRGPSVKES